MNCIYEKFRQSFILRAVSFFLIFVLVLSFLNGIFKSRYIRGHVAFSSGDAIVKQVSREPAGSIEVLVIGDSESYTSFSPMTFWKHTGVTSFAAGKPGSKLAETKKILNGSLKRQHPKVVLLETNNLFRFGSAAKKTDVASKDLSRAIYQAFPFLRYHSFWKTPSSKNRRFMGYQISGRVKPYKGVVVNKRIVTGDVITKANFRDLDAIQKKCRASGAKLVLYSAPSPRCYTEQKTAYLTHIAKQRKIPYLNLAGKEKEIGIDWRTDTRDQGDHLNSSGALKTTSYLSKWLVANCGLTPNQNPKVVHRWAKKYTAYSVVEGKAINRIDRHALMQKTNGRKMLKTSRAVKSPNSALKKGTIE